MNRLARLGLALSLLAAGCGRETPPNIALVVLDTVRADALGGDLNGSPATPTLDRLFAEGTVFTDALAPAPWTVPSHATLFTGLYPRRHGAVHERFRLADSVTTAAQRLAAIGYETYGLSCNPWLNRQSGIARGFDVYDEVYRLAEDEREKGGRIATEKATKWLEDRSRKRPFFLFVNYLEAHLPYAPLPGVLERHGFRDSTLATHLRTAEAFILDPSQASREALDQAYQLYRAEIAYLDDLVRLLVDGLEANGYLENTMLVITSDHGEHFGEHGLMGHEFSLYEPVLRIPLAIRYPPAFPAGDTVATPVGLVDLLPTVLAVVGVRDVLDDLPGRDLRGLEMRADADGYPLFAEYARPRTLIHRYWRQKYPDADLSHYDRALQAVRIGTQKLIRVDGGEAEVSDLEADAGEERDRSGVAPADRRRLVGALDAFEGGRAVSQILGDLRR